MQVFLAVFTTLLACSMAQRGPRPLPSVTRPTVPTNQPWPTGRPVPTGGPWATGRPRPTGQPWRTGRPVPTGGPWPTGQPWPRQTGRPASLPPLPRDGPNDNLIPPPQPQPQQPTYSRSRSDWMDEVVAFSAYMAQPNVQSVRNTVIPFANVLTNVRNGFDSASSRFTAPRRGVYSFFARLDCSNNYSGFNIVQDGSKVVATAHNDGGGRSLMASVILVLERGSTVDVRHAGNVGTIDGGLESAFTGFRIGDD